jgi:hypothetical protein
MPSDEKPSLSEEEKQEIARHRAEALKRVQELREKGQHESHTSPGGKGGKNQKQPPPKGRNFRHQGR